jgi:probable F420-dependent oxidoreductase
MMRIGLALPSFGPLSLDPGIVPLAQMAEAAGADSVWVPDHLCVPANATSRYPYSADGALPFEPDTPWLDCLAVLAAIAAATRTVAIGTAVLVLTQRNPLEIAKVASTIDQLSGGRLTLGVGAGWFEEEIRSLGYEPRGRGRRLDDSIRALHDCWRGTTHGFAGATLSVDEGIIFEPTPVNGGVPVIVGGTGARAIRRAAELADGWIPGGDIDMLDFTVLARTKRDLEQRLRQAGRADRPFRNILVVDTPPDRVSKLGEVAKQAAALGFDEMIFDLPSQECGSVAGIVNSVREAARG